MTWDMEWFALGSVLALACAAVLCLWLFGKRIEEKKALTICLIGMALYFSLSLIRIAKDNVPTVKTLFLEMPQKAHLRLEMFTGGYLGSFATSMAFVALIFLGGSVWHVSTFRSRRSPRVAVVVGLGAIWFTALALEPLIWQALDAERRNFVDTVVVLLQLAFFIWAAPLIIRSISDRDAKLPDGNRIDK